MSAVKELADLAMALLAGAESRELSAGGIQFAFRYSGPKPAPEISDQICAPAIVRETPQWSGACILKVMAPLNVLKISWNEGEAVRIMAFSRGSWEDALNSA